MLVTRTRPAGKSRVGLLPGDHVVYMTLATWSDFLLSTNSPCCLRKCSSKISRIFYFLSDNNRDTTGWKAWSHVKRTQYCITEMAHYLSMTLVGTSEWKEGLSFHCLFGLARGHYRRICPMRDVRRRWQLWTICKADQHVSMDFRSWKLTEGSRAMRWIVLLWVIPDDGFSAPFVQILLSRWSDSACTAPRWQCRLCSWGVNFYERHQL